MEYYKELRKHVGHQPIILPGAVVIIVNADGEILLQLRNDDTWGLPGGLMELGESFVDTARREVLEETGLQVGELHLVEVFSGSECYRKLANGDEFYAVTAVYTTKEFSGELRLDEAESKDLQFFALNSLPENIGKGYQDHISAYLLKVTCSPR